VRATADAPPPLVESDESNDAGDADASDDRAKASKALGELKEDMISGISKYARGAVRRITQRP
jgi:hypothetical protein